MAEVALSDVANVLQKVFAPYVTSQINRSSALIQILPVDDVEGQNVQHVVEFGNAAGTGATAEGAAASAFNSDTKVPAILPMCTYTEAFGANGIAIYAALNSPNPLALKNLFQRELDTAVERLTMSLSNDLYSGDGTVGPGGGVRITGLLGGAVGATGIYSGINRATYAQWASIVRANGGAARALSFNLMRDLSTRVVKASGRRPDLFSMGPATHDEFGKLFQDNRRYIHEVNAMDGTIKLSGGYKILDFDGMPVIEDNTCPEGKVVGLRMSKARLKQLPQRGGMEITRAMGQEALKNNTGPVRGLTARIQPLAILGDKFTFQLVVYVQLCVEQCNACGVLDDIQYAS